MKGVRRRGIDVLTTAEAGKPGASDEEHFVFASRQGPIIVTHDADFLRLAAATSDPGGGLFTDRWVEVLEKWSAS